MDFAALALTPRKVYAEMGIRHAKVDEQTAALTAEYLEQFSAWVRPRYSYRIVDGEVDGDAVVLASGTRFQVGEVLARLLRGSRQFAVFAATAGQPFQDFQDTLKLEGDIFKDYVADAIGSCIAEAAGDVMEKDVAAQVPGWRHTNRVSPGYCGWPLLEQKALFAELDDQLGISLSDVCLMRPIKSISGMIGIGPDVLERQYGCGYCTIENCYRRKHEPVSFIQPTRQE
ncbi:MAG: hypothetical protein LBR20_07790 [Propionibacteriaceae bacterium]|jgi:hypothetical protein|nr:hypothetical protein [Propionibacteriaceae bacterium]